tara:strand:+ start:1573 stop:2148 length:576 start_codon:yes stop_codon:yes gene_type:complete
MKTVLISFITIVIIQLFIPAKMIYDRELPKIYGEEFKFETRPIDPYDPFRGKYVTLNFAANEIGVNRTEKWKGGDIVYVKFEKAENGLAIISSIHKKEPRDTDFYLKTKVSHVQRGKKCSVFINYPFTRYYMEETKAEKAEMLTMSLDREKQQIISATVKLYRGEATITALMVNDISMEKAVGNDKIKHYH